MLNGNHKRQKRVEDKTWNKESRQQIENSNKYATYQYKNINNYFDYQWYKFKVIVRVNKKTLPNIRCVQKTHIWAENKWMEKLPCAH